MHLLRTVHTHILILFIACVPLVTWGQTDRTNDEAPAAVEAAPVEMAPTNYNNTRSNRSSVVAPVDTNICDGVTCSDGSCAATAAECPLATEAASASPTTCPIMNPVRCADGSCVRETAQCPVGAAELVRPACGIDDDCDGMIEEGIGTTDCDDQNDCRHPDEPSRVPDGTAPTPNPPAATPPADYLDPDDDGDGIPTDYYPDADGDGFGEPTNRAQSHNSSRSNRTEGVAADGVDPDFDTDQSQVEWRAGRFVTEGSATDNGSDWVVSWGRAVDSTGTNHSWGRGVAVLPQVNSDAAANARDRISALQVSGEAVRAWSEEERTSWQSYQATEQSEFPELQLLAHVIEQTQLNERILEMRVGDDEPSDDVVLDYQPITVRYQTELRLFGFIPLEREIEAGISNDGKLAVTYPWYRILSTTPEHTRLESLLQDTLGMLR